MAVDQLHGNAPLNHGMSRTRTVYLMKFHMHQVNNPHTKKKKLNSQLDDKMAMETFGYSRKFLAMDKLTLLKRIIAVY